MFCFFFLTRQQRQEKWPWGLLTPFFLSPPPSLSFPLSPHLPAFLFLPLQHVLCCPASRRAYRCHCQLFAPSVTLWSREKMSSQKQIAVRFFFCFFLFFLFIYFLWTLNSHERAIPDDWVTLNSPNLDKKRPDEGKNFIPTSRVPEILTSV